MNIDPGLAVVLVAGLFFYLRVTILQREKAKRVRREMDAAVRKQKAKKGEPPAPRPSYSILSKKPVDLVIAGAGALAIIFGALLNSKSVPIPALQPYWWVFMSLGFIAFGWMFKL